MQLGCIAKVSATNKLQVLEDWQKDMGLSWKEVAYLGLFFCLFAFGSKISYSIHKYKLHNAAQLQNTLLFVNTLNLMGLMCKLQHTITKNSYIF